MSDSTFSVAIGHFTDNANCTGLTVFLLPQPSACGWWLCGSAPATRDVTLLAPEAMVDKIHGLLFSGGSAFGLGAANGVMQWLLQQGKGFETPGGLVPIVPTACIYDLQVGRPIAPTAEQAYQACQQAIPNNPAMGSVGVGTGATVGKLLANTTSVPGGYGYASLLGANGVEVRAYAAVNSVGSIINERGEVVAGDDLDSTKLIQALQQGKKSKGFSTMTANSTLVAVMTNAHFNKAALTRIARMASAGMARAIVPVFTTYDGDVVFSLSLGKLPADEITVGVLAAEAVRLAIIAAVNKNNC
jgi:L-aminopeptidase/D-esterase-like protein